MTYLYKEGIEIMETSYPEMVNRKTGQGWRIVTMKELEEMFPDTDYKDKEMIEVKKKKAGRPKKEE